MGHWTPTGIEPTDYDDDEYNTDIQTILSSFSFPGTPYRRVPPQKALPFSHPPLHSFTPLFPSPLSTPQLLIEEMRKSPTHTPPTHLHCWQVLITPKNILTLHLTFS